MKWIQLYIQLKVQYVISLLKKESAFTTGGIRSLKNLKQLEFTDPNNYDYLDLLKKFLKSNNNNVDSNKSSSKETIIIPNK